MNASSLESKWSVASGQRLATSHWSLTTGFRFYQVFEFVHELFYVLEIQIHGCEANVSDLVVAAQPVHDQFAEFAGLTLALWRFDHETFGFIHDLFELAHRHRALFTGAQQAIKNFLPVEFLAAAIFLDHHVGNLVYPLIGGKALSTLQAVAASPDRIGFLALARVDYLI